MSDVELTQKWGARTIQVALEETKLVYRSKTKQTNEEYAVPYADLQENPVRQGMKAPLLNKENLAGLILCFICAIPALFMLDGASYGEITLLVIGISAIIGIVWKLIQSRKKAFDLWHYGFASGGGAFSIHAKSPSEQEVTAFRDKLEDLIKKFSPESAPMANGSAASEIHQLHRLHEAGVLTAEEFQNAKTRVLEADKAPRAIGFEACA